MPPEYLAPGVYVEEIPTKVHSIPGVSTGPSPRTESRRVAHRILETMPLRRCGSSTALRLPRTSAGFHVFFPGSNKGARLSSLRRLARELQRGLIRVDLSRVANKYIGETEKILSKAFAAAEAAGSVLFFDEADALFGKRTGVRDGHDRYHNVEISSLLQRLETFHGMVIVSINRRENLAEAFLRKCQFNIPGSGKSDAKGNRFVGAVHHS